MRNRPLVTPQRSALMVARAHGMRHSMTPSEAALWNELRGSKLGVAFRRQVVIGRYIADFVAPAARLVVEVDGKCHRLRVAADARRDRALGKLGYRVLRLDAELVLRNPAGAVGLVRAALA